MNSKYLKHFRFCVRIKKVKEYDTDYYQLSQYERRKNDAVHKIRQLGLECIPHLYGLYGIRRRCERAAYMDDR